MSAPGTSSGGLFSRSSTGQAPMRGLVSFIADLRNARARELEEKRINKELANIRQRFKEPGLNGYQRKKYVCKLLYIYILGWDVDFGHVEAVRLVSANTYSEKQIGYLAVTLFLHEQHELLPLVVNTFKKDLTDSQELYNCLALHAIANVGSREMADALSIDVYRLLVSPMSRTFVKKKAALTLLRLYRKHPQIMNPDWAPKVIAIMDDADFGVALSVASLITALVQQEPDLYKDSYIKAVRRLRGIVIDGECASDYYYYKVPCPWFQIKLMRILQYYPPSEDNLVRELLQETLMRVFDTQSCKNVQQNNAQNAVLFEAISLAIHLGDDAQLSTRISGHLSTFIQSRETNVRYLGMAAMTHLAARSHDLSAIRQHQPVILGALRDRDVTVRKQGLDLLYSICDVSTAPSIVAELISNLETVDSGVMREEIVLKVAILAEKYATEARWYVDTSLRLLATAGDSVGGDVWQRVVQVVTNNESLQEYTARTVLEYLRNPRCHDAVVKIGAYLLGEFGHLVADQPNCSPVEQFNALQSKIYLVSRSTKVMIVSSFVKFVNLFPEIKHKIVTVFLILSINMDAELQQRCCEYLALTQMKDDSLLRAVCDEMPPFPPRRSALLARLHQRHAASGDRQTWVVGGRDANQNSAEVDLALKTDGPNGTGPRSAQSGGVHSDLEGVDLSAKTVQSSTEGVFPLGWELGYNMMMFRVDGVLFENSLIRIFLDRTCHAGECSINFTFLNMQQEFPLRSLTASVELPPTKSDSPFPILKDLRSLPDSTVPPRSKTSQSVHFKALRVFRPQAAETAPILRLSFLAGTVSTLLLRIPLSIHHFNAPVSLAADAYFKRWKQIGPQREAQKIFGLEGNPEVSPADGEDESKTAGFKRVISAEFTTSVVQAFGWEILQGVDQNPNNIVGASVLHTVEDGNIGLLLRLEPHMKAMMYRLTIRATGNEVAATILESMATELKKGVPK